MDTQRLPPHAHDAEQAALACVLNSPNECLSQLIKRFGNGGPEVFYDLRHQTIYSECVEMANASPPVPIDIITLQQRLKDRQLLDQIGGIPYLIATQDAVTSAANVSYYADILFEKWQLRRMIQTCTSVVQRAYECTGEIDVLVDEVERDILALSQPGSTEDRGVKLLVQGAISKLEQYHQRQGQIMGLGTGFPDFDRMTDGLHPGEMIVIAARPSMGKTSLAMNIAEHVALTLKLPVGMFSLEMTAESLVLRSLCSVARVNLRNIRDGFMSEMDFPKLTSAAGRINVAPLHIDDTPGLSILQLRARARRMHQQHGIKLLVVDYMQLLSSGTPRAQDSRQQEISEISGGLKALAKELGIPIIVLSQMNRDIEKEKNRRPRLSDLRESGAIEQDADVVGLLYKPGVTNAEENEEQVEDQDGLPVNLLIAKQRNGPTGDVHLTFLKSYTRFESAARVSDEDVPSGRAPHND